MAVVVVMTVMVVMGVRLRHGFMLYYNITGVYKDQGLQGFETGLRAAWRTPWITMPASSGL